MSKPETLIVQLPFAGFYESVHDQQIDQAQEMDAEHFASKDNDLYPNAVGMEESDINNILFLMADYSKAHDAYVRAYVKNFNRVVEKETGVDLGLEFEKMESPREYNFGTDRIFAFIPTTVMEQLRAAISLGNLAEVVKERHESRPGFASFYDTDMEVWAKKPVTAMDHNELMTVLITWMRQEMTQDADESIDDDTIDCDSEMGCDAWQKAVDWDKFDAKCAEFKKKQGEKQ